VQFPGTVMRFDAAEGFGYIVRDRDRHEILVRRAGLAVGVETLSEGDRVEFDIDAGTHPQARNVMRR
jgi:cold shock CspA family protein